MEHQLSPGYLAMEFALCAGIHIVFGIFNVEPVLEGAAVALKGMPAIA